MIEEKEKTLFIQIKLLNFIQKAYYENKIPSQEAKNRSEEAESKIKEMLRGINFEDFIIKYGLSDQTFALDKVSVIETKGPLLKLRDTLKKCADCIVEAVFIDQLLNSVLKAHLETIFDLLNQVNTSWKFQYSQQIQKYLLRVQSSPPDQKVEIQTVNEISPILDDMTSKINEEFS